MRRGDICLIDLDPVRGSEANKRRPAVVVSNDRANRAAEHTERGVITIVPLSSNITQVFPFQTLLPAEVVGLRVDSKAQAEQVRSVGAERLGPVVATVPAFLMLELDDALRLHLQL
jgi:mRNA interferase MazF